MKTWLLLAASATAIAIAGCEADQDLGGDGSGGGQPVNDCRGQACGAACLGCPPNSPGCADPSYQGYCTDGACIAQQPSCGTTTCTKCGDPCIVCEAGTPDCAQTIQGICNPNLGCSTMQYTCPVDVCAGKACGSTCPCGSTGCTGGSWFCDTNGACVPQQPVCQ